MRGGSGDAAIHAKQVFAEQYAGEMRLPVVRLLDGASGGGSVKMTLEAGYAYVPVDPAWDAVVDNLSLVPVVAACLGPVVGLGAARLVMSHLAVMVTGIGQLFAAGPPVVRGGTGEDLTKEQLGGAAVHRGNGTIERFTASEDEAFEVVRAFLSYLPGSVFEVPPVRTLSAGADDPPGRRGRVAAGRGATRPPPALPDPADPRRGLRSGLGVHLRRVRRSHGHGAGPAGRAPGRGAGHRPVQGHDDVGGRGAGGDPAGRPVRDLPPADRQPHRQGGPTVGRVAEERGTIRYGARAIAAIYQARVPQAELILRRVYGVGGAGIVNRHRAGRSWAWPSGDWGSLPVQGGVEAAFRADLERASDPAAEIERIRRRLAEVGSPFRTAERFGVQDLIDPRDSRPLLCAWVRDAYRVLPELTGRPPSAPAPDARNGEVAIPRNGRDKRGWWGRSAGLPGCGRGSADVNVRKTTQRRLGYGTSTDGAGRCELSPWPRTPLEHRLPRDPARLAKDPARSRLIVPPKSRVHEHADFSVTMTEKSARS